MSGLPDVARSIEELWEEPGLSEITSMKIDVSIYRQLSRRIPDKFILIENVFAREELQGVWGNYEQYLSEYQILPFLGTLGEAVICIGYGGPTQGRVFYFDFDFGCIELEGDNLKTFLGKLVAA